MKNKHLLISVMLIILVVTVLNYVLLINAESQLNKESYTTLISDCSGMNLFNTSYCLKEELSYFYKYNISNIGKDLTAEELVNNGGVCWHYANLYYKKMKNLGFYAEIKTFWANETDGHSFTIAWDKDFSGYCTLDQLLINCVEFNK